jgi:rare lipoprotein A
LPRSTGTAPALPMASDINPDGISAAHKRLAFGSIVDVRNQRTGRAVRVRINDRGPFIAGRIIDLSRGAARAMGMNGLAPVCISVVGHAARHEASRHKAHAIIGG